MYRYYVIKPNLGLIIFYLIVVLIVIYVHKRSTYLRDFFYMFTLCHNENIFWKRLSVNCRPMVIVFWAYHLSGICNFIEIVNRVKDYRSWVLMLQYVYDYTKLIRFLSQLSICRQLIRLPLFFSSFSKWFLFIIILQNRDWKKLLGMHSSHALSNSLVSLGSCYCTLTSYKNEIWIQ